jgi:hypothetical protein
MHSRSALCLLILVVSAAACGDDDDTSNHASASEASGADSPSAGKGAAGKGAAGKAAAGSSAAGKGAAGKGGAGPKDAGPYDGDGGDGKQDTSGDTDYATAENWLCRPNHNAACAVDLDTTIVKADGSLESEKFEAKSDAPIDCFYVYPTVSLDSTPNSDLVAGQEEESVVRAQFARFASQCRLFAPLYRQVTLTALRTSLGGGNAMPDRMVGYRDVLAAWQYYLEHDNDGRGVVLVGHSQGSGVLAQLIQKELDKKPLDKRFIAALLLGTNVTVPKDKAVGGTFANVPLCKSADDLGCIIVYASFRDTTPPPDNSLFATSMDPNLVAACVNPAAIGGGSGELHSYLTTGGPGTSSTLMGPWIEGKTIDTPFVSPPGLLTAECKAGKSGSYLSIHVNADSADSRADDISGDVVTNGEVQANWGLHLIDAHLAMGNLLDLVKSKSTAYQAH